MSINVSACRYDGKTKEKSTLSYDDVFRETGNKPYKFVVWAHNLTLKAFKFATSYEEKLIHEKNAAYLYKYVQMGA